MLRIKYSCIHVFMQTKTNLDNDGDDDDDIIVPDGKSIDII